MADYDQYYLTEDLFGDPYPELIDFFDRYEPKGRLIDLGCGQGRDAIALAKLGYEVTGLDKSQVGIDQMLRKARQARVQVAGLVEDIYEFSRFSDFDILLLDSMFHFDKRNRKRETDFIARMAAGITPNTLVCFCIQDLGSKVEVLKNTLHQAEGRFEILNDSYFTYGFEDRETGRQVETRYCMYIVKKK